VDMKGVSAYPRTALDPSFRTGLILCGMGGPDGPDAVEPFLRNLFRDPAIFPVPRLLAPLIGAMIARKRSASVAERYLLMDPAGATPQLKYTRDQAGLLARLLTDATGADIVPDVAMRYWRPFPDQTVAGLVEQGVRQYIVVPTYPQYSPATGGSTMKFVLESLSRLAPEAPVHTVPSWHSLGGMVRNLAEPVIDQLGRWAAQGLDPATCGLIYVAHSMPAVFIKKGDPYEKLTRDTVARVHGLVRQALSRDGHGQWLDGLASDLHSPLAYQSKVGPIKWLEPGVEPETMRLAAAGCRHLMVQPVSFVCEHIETLVELDIELEEEALAAGVTEFRRGPALNLQPEWLESLAEKIISRAFTTEVEPHV
jgi:ferrochelatase